MLMEKEEYEKRIGYIKDLFEYYAAIYIQCLESKDKGAAKEAMKQIDAILDMYLELKKRNN